MAHRNVHVFDVRKMAEPAQKRESALKFMTRSVACMADGKGASGSKLGRGWPVAGARADKGRRVCAHPQAGHPARSRAE